MPRFKPLYCRVKTLPNYSRHHVKQRNILQYIQLVLKFMFFSKYFIFSPASTFEQPPFHCLSSLSFRFSPDMTLCLCLLRTDCYTHCLFLHLTFLSATPSILFSPSAFAYPDPIKLKGHLQELPHRKQFCWSVQIISENGW